MKRVLPNILKRPHGRDGRGLREALTRCLPGAAHQRCQVHHLRNLLAQCSSPEPFAAVKARLQDIWESATREAADAKLRALLKELEEKHPRLANWIEKASKRPSPHSN